jgi:glycosyltransferase involved in cell wall biosynthesis
MKCTTPEHKTVTGGLRSRGAMKHDTPDMPLVSVITVVRNGAAHLRETIESVIGQSWPNTEFIIIDGASTDGTLDIIRSYDQNIDYWVSEPDNGIFDAMNKGITLAQGALIGLLNADDWYEPGALETAATAYRGEKKQGIYFGDKYLVHVDLGLKYEFRGSLEFWRGMTICHQAMFVHREAYERLGYYDQAYRLAADFDFFVRAILSGIPFIRLDRFVVNFRDDGASAQSLVQGNREISTILRSNYGFLSSPYLKNLLLTGYNLTAVAVSRLIGRMLGSRVQQWARRCYYRLSRGNHAE